MLKEIQQELIDEGKNPNDFIIEINEGRITIIPKWGYEIKKMANKLDEPIKEDSEIIADTVAYLFDEIERLKGLIDND